MTKQDWWNNEDTVTAEKGNLKKIALRVLAVLLFLALFCGSCSLIAAQ